MRRVNRAIDYVTQNLAEPLKLDDVAKVACFSSFHFHRVFRAVIGETLHDFVKRTRLERALYLLAHGDPRSLTDIALACGFGSSSDFSKSFRAHFGLPPRSFDVALWKSIGRGRLVDSLPANQRIAAALGVDDNPDRFTVEVRKLPARRVAYLRVLRPFEEGRVRSAADRLVGWARARSLERGQWLGYQWEDPQLVPFELCRYDVGIEVPDSAVLDGDVSEARFPPMQVAEIGVTGPLVLELRAFTWLYQSWLPQSGYLPDHQPRFEAWNGTPFLHGEEHFDLRVQLAVVDAATVV